MAIPISPVEARRQYFLYLSTPGRKYIPYRTWKTQQRVEVESTAYVKRLIALTGYPGKSEVDDIRYWVNQQLDGLWNYVNGWQSTVDNAVNQAFGTAQAWITNLYSTVANIVSTIGNILGRNQSDLLVDISTISEWIEDTINHWGDIIYGAIKDTSDWITYIGTEIRDGIVDAVNTLADRMDSMTSQIVEAIDRQQSQGDTTLSGITDLIVATIEGAVTIATSIIDGITEVLSQLISTLGDTIENAIDNSVKMIDTLVNGLTEIVRGTTTDVIDFLKWLWEQVTLLLDQMFDFNPDHIAPLLAGLFEAYQRAYAIIKERSETVQP